MRILNSLSLSVPPINRKIESNHLYAKLKAKGIWLLKLCAIIDFQIKLRYVSHSPKSEWCMNRSSLNAQVIN